MTHQHIYINNSYTNDQITKMKSKESDTIIQDNFLSQAEFDTLRQLINEIEYPEHGSTSKYAGSSYEYPPHGPIVKKILDDKLTDLIGPYKIDFFAWQEAIKPWKIHADLRWYKDKVPFKVILIPLDVISDNSNSKWADTYSITFKQRNYLRNNKNDNTGSTGNNDQSHWKKPIIDKSVEGCISGYSIDEKTHAEYLSHMPYDYLEGLEIDRIFHWKPRSIVIWDQTALHCADNFLRRDIKTKLSLIMMTNYV